MGSVLVSSITLSESSMTCPRVASMIAAPYYSTMDSTSGIVTSSAESIAASTSLYSSSPSVSTMVISYLFSSSSSEGISSTAISSTAMILSLLLEVETSSLLLLLLEDGRLLEDDEELLELEDENGRLPRRLEGGGPSGIGFPMPSP